MKTKILVLTFIIASFGVIFPNAASLKAEEIVSSELPSSQYMNEEGYIFSRGSVSARENSISIYAETFGLGDAWGDDPFFPGTGGDEGSWAGNVGGPIGDVTPVIVVLLVLAYFIFRNVTISRRKNL